jgi:hypothetical protein
MTGAVDVQVRNAGAGVAIQNIYSSKGYGRRRDRFEKAGLYLVLIGVQLAVYSLLSFYEISIKHRFLLSHSEVIDYYIYLGIAIAVYACCGVAYLLKMMRTEEQ